MYDYTSFTSPNNYWHKTHPLHHLICIDMEECCELAESTMNLSSVQVIKELEREFGVKGTREVFKASLRMAERISSKLRREQNGSTT